MVRDLLQEGQLIDSHAQEHEGFFIGALEVAIRPNDLIEMQLHFCAAVDQVRRQTAVVWI